MERYLPFFREKNKARIDDRSDTGWINGIYISRAIGASFSKKGKYPDSPIKFYDDPVYDEDDIEMQTSFEIARFKSFANAFNNSHSELASLEDVQTGDPDTAERP